MARYYYSGARGTVNGSQTISIFWLRKNNYLSNDKCHFYGNIRWSRNEETTGRIGFEIETDEDKGAHFRLIYRTKKHWEPDENYKDMDYKFDLVSLPCRFGGKRWYFKCGLYKNGTYCGRRVAILHNLGTYFGCRKCAELSYDSCNENKRYKRGVYGILSKSWDADEYLASLKRYYYNGKPTRKFRKYLKLERTSPMEEKVLEDFIKKSLTPKTSK